VEERGELRKAARNIETDDYYGCELMLIDVFRNKKIVFERPSN